MRLPVAAAVANRQVAQDRPAWVVVAVTVANVIPNVIRIVSPWTDWTPVRWAWSPLEVATV